jgi:hypothetical protein
MSADELTLGLNTLYSDRRYKDLEISRAIQGVLMKQSTIRSSGEAH